MCIRTHSHTARGVLGTYSDVSPGVGTRHLEGPENPDGLNLSTYVFVYVYKVHMCIYMLGGGMRSWTNCLVQKTPHVQAWLSWSERGTVYLQYPGTQESLRNFEDFNHIVSVTIPLH